MKLNAAKTIPRVLLQAKKLAQEKNNLGLYDKSPPYDKGPWDKGHWANRK